MQKYRAEAQRAIDATPDEVWSIIAPMTGMEDWYPGLIASSDVDASQDPPTRHCVMQDGGDLHERVLVRDAKTRTFVYAIDSHPLPATGVVGTIRVDPAAAGSTVTWDAQFTADPAASAQLIGMIGEMYRAGLESLATYATTKKET